MKHLLLFFLVITFSANAQKRTHYWNDDLKAVTKAEHAALPGYELEFELDTAVVIVKVMGRKNGKISSDLWTKIRSGLSQTSGVDIAEDETIVIHYYPGADPCNRSGNAKLAAERLREYQKKLKKQSKVKGFFVYKDRHNIARYGKKISWIQDPEQLIERCFFPIHYGCDSGVIIWPDGSYHAKRGEYAKDRIFEQLAIGPQQNEAIQKP